MADSIPYPDVGNQAATYTFQATNTGSITAYFYGSSAAYTSVIGMSVNNAPVSVWGLNNHSSAYGNSFVLGNVNAGDIITFQLFVYDLSYAWSSNLAQNYDGLNHVYGTLFGGDSTIPAGTYVGFEDLPYGGDNDYNDHQFVFTNVARAVPEPESLALLGVGMIAVVGLKLRPSSH
jgi:Domain of unknown function (DUF4114)/PEP-CTERM motif